MSRDFHLKFYKDEARGSLENDKGRLRDDEEESLFEALEQETISCGNDRGKDQSVGVFHKQAKECTIRDRTQDGDKISFREGGIGSISKVQVIHITHSLTHSQTHTHTQVQSDLVQSHRVMGTLTRLPNIVSQVSERDQDAVEKNSIGSCHLHVQKGKDELERSQT